MGQMLNSNSKREDTHKTKNFLKEFQKTKYFSVFLQLESQPSNFALTSSHAQPLSTKCSCPPVTKKKNLVAVNFSGASSERG